MPVKPDTDGYHGDHLLEPLDSHYSHLADATVLVDLRKHPRFDTRFPAEAIAVYGHRTRASITNLSRTGLRLEGDRQMLDTLFPGYCAETGHATTSLQVSFSVPAGPDRHHPVKARCRSVYILEATGNNWQIGMAFSDIATGSTALTEYLLLREDAG